jgi:hypothetical protein
MLLIQTVVRPSPIHGLGLFTQQALRKGTPVWRMQPGFDRELAPAEVAALPPTARDHVTRYGYLRKTDGWTVLSGDHACFMNHAAAPNTGAPPEATPPVTTVALRDLAAGEELTCDYYAFDAGASQKLGR